MSASVCNSSRRAPVRRTRSSTERNRKERCEGCEGCAECDQSCAHVLQKNDPSRTTSIIDRSSHPHFGHRSGSLCPPPSALCPKLLALSIARPTSSRKPFT